MIARLKETLGRKNSKIYSILPVQSWWKDIVNEEGVYVEVRKDNVVEVYFKGRLVAKLEEKKGKLSACCHKKYLGDSESVYIDCLEKLETDYKDIIKGIENYVKCLKTANKKDISEKEIQGDIIAGSIRDKFNYFIDSEFAHRYDDDGRNTIRFDMVAIKENKLYFMELKRISDQRMLNKNDNNPEVLAQMTKYAEFIKVNSNALLEYYKKLYSIKKMLGLPVPDCNVEKLQLNEKPHLVVCDTYTRHTQGRDDRIERIKGILDNKSDEFSWCLVDLNTIHDIQKII